MASAQRQKESSKKVRKEEAQQRLTNMLRVTWYTHKY